MKKLTLEYFLGIKKLILDWLINDLVSLRTRLGNHINVLKKYNAPIKKASKFSKRRTR